MCVVAHPDDECFGFGGALALAADRGVETAVLCLTEGSAGSYRGTAETAADLARMRRGEFAASCEVLGVSEHEVLGYGDGRLEFADFSALAGEIVARLRRLRPDVVLTFGGEGGLNTHPDHTMVSALTTAAFHWAGNERRYTGTGDAWQADRLFYLSADVLLPDRRAPLPAPWTVSLDIESVRERKAEAFTMHRSQAPLVEATRPFFAAHGGREFYTLAAGRQPRPASLGSDLFAGLE